MNGRRRRATSVITLAVAATVGLSACGHGTTTASPTPTATRRLPPLVATPLPSGVNVPTCKPPKPLPLPAWLPPDLPFPVGTYASQLLPEASGYNRAILVVPGSLVALTRFVLEKWPQSGWILGRGESEPGEVEDQFSKPPAVGAFKAQSVYCTPGYNLMLVIYTPDRGQLPTPGTQPSSPLSPAPSASPSS